MDPKFFHVVEFYISGKTKPFARHSGIFNTPSKGDGIDLYGVRGKVSSVTWNMDYPHENGEQWRCSIYIREEPTND